MLHSLRFISRPEDYNLSRLVKNKKDYSKIVLITDENTTKFCKPLLDYTNVNYTDHINLGRLTETEKSPETLEKLWSALMEISADRNTAIVVLGGGLLSDLAGYAASVYKRGLQLYLIPSTLLAMVDAAIGGKNGINFKGIKNQIGTVNMPREVIIDPRFLSTLPHEEMMSGTAEMLKHALIARPSYFDHIITALEKGLPAEDLPPLIRRSVEIKTGIVQRDPHETGLRKVLNFGHTLGHALEACMHRNGKPITHGHAVAIGMMAALDLSVALGLDSEMAGLYKSLLKKYYPVPPGREKLLECLLETIRHDKKNTGDEVRFVLLKAPGIPVYNLLVPNELLKDIWKSL